MEPGSTSPDSTSSNDDALDKLEAWLLNLLRNAPDSDSEAENRAAYDSPERLVNDALPPESRLYPEPPPIDPSEGRRSKAEVLRLLDVLQGVPGTLPPPHTRTRAGYSFVPQGFRSGEPGVFPAFVAALGAKDLRTAFPDLWAVDAALWDKLDGTDAKELARLWLESPGRRLVQDLRVIDDMPSGGRLGATDFSAPRIDAAIGLDRIAVPTVSSSLRAFHELYRAIAGETYLHLWEPHPLPKDKSQQILRALQLLEEGSPLGLRGAALRWLLDAAADKPFYEIDGVRRDLREDLSMRLGTALRSWVSETHEATVSRQLETLALQHGARFVANDPSDHATKRAWAIARWLQACLRGSPFFGGDEEVLAAHLDARLSRPLPAVPRDADALHPARFSVDAHGLNVADVAFVAGVIVHYEQPRERQLLPTPLPIVHALQRLADRDVDAAEEDADRARLAGRKALGWPKDYSVIVAVAARRLMTELRIGWLGHVAKKAQLDSITRFLADPRQHTWFAFAVHREGQHLVEEARHCAAAAFRELATTDRIEPHVLGTFAAGILGELTESEVKSVLDIAARSEPPWGPFVLDAVAGATNPVQTNALWTLAIERLVRWMEDAGADEKTRLNSALFAMRRVSASKAPNRDAWLLRLAASSGDRPFSTHTGLQTELRRLGLSKTNAAGSKR